MPKKEKAEEKKDPMGMLTKGIESQVKIIRTDMMGEFQNKLVDLIDTSSLMAQEICFVIDLTKKNVMDNFIQMMASREAKIVEEK